MVLKSLLLLCANPPALPTFSHAIQMTPSCFSQERAVCFCSAKQWLCSKQQRLHFYALVLEQDSHSLNHHLQSPTTETLVIKNLWDHPCILQTQVWHLSEEKNQLEDWNFMPPVVKVDTKEASVEVPHYPKTTLMWWVKQTMLYIFLYFLNSSITP